MRSVALPAKQYCLATIVCAVLLSTAPAGTNAQPSDRALDDSGCVPARWEQTLSVRGSIASSDYVFDDRHVLVTLVTFSPPICIDGGPAISRVSVFQNDGKHAQDSVSVEVSGILARDPTWKGQNAHPNIVSATVTPVSLAATPPATVASNLRRRIEEEQRCVKGAQDQIAHEQEIGRASGVVNKVILHNAGEMLTVCQRELARLQRCAPNDERC